MNTSSGAEAPSDRNNFLSKKTARYSIQLKPYEIWGLRRGVVEAFALLGCYAAYVGSCLPTFRDSLSIPSSRAECMTLEDGTDTLF